MSSIDEIRARLASTTEQATGVLGALEQASMLVSDIRAQVAQTTDGSGQAAVQDALGAWAQVAESLDQAKGLVGVAQSSADQFAASL